MRIYKNICIVIGMLDIISFARTYKILMTPLIPDLMMLILMLLPMALVLSLLVSAFYSFFNQKVAVKIYFFQFPLRLLFLTLTFGFLANINTLFKSDISSLLMVIMIILEIGRLAYSIFIYKLLSRAKTAI